MAKEGVIMRRRPVFFHQLATIFLMLILRLIVVSSFVVTDQQLPTATTTPPLTKMKTLAKAKHHRHHHMLVSPDMHLDVAVFQSIESSASTVLSHASASSSIGGVPILPVIGSSCIMLTIVALLYTWEESVEYVRETIPKPLKPVVESIS